MICKNNDQTCLFHCINTCRVPRMMLNTRPIGLVFKQHPRDPANVNSWKNMCDPYIQHNEEVGMCEQWRFKSVCLSAQFDQSLSLQPEDTLDAWLPIERPLKTLIRVVDGYTCKLVPFAGHHRNLTLKAAPIICSRWQLKILPLFKNNK